MSLDSGLFSLSRHMHMLRKICLIILVGSIFLLISHSHTMAQDVSKYQALFMSKFMDYIQWPEGNENFVFGVVGNSRVLTELQNLMDAKGRKVTIKKITNASSVEGCHIVFLPVTQSKLFQTVYKSSQGTSTLIVAEDEKLAPQGAVITFYVDGGKLKFIINKKAANARKLKISGSLMSLAKVI